VPDGLPLARKQIDLMMAYGKSIGLGCAVRAARSASATKYPTLNFETQHFRFGTHHRQEYAQ